MFNHVDPEHEEEVLMALPQQGTETFSLASSAAPFNAHVLMALPQQGTETDLLAC